MNAMHCIDFPLTQDPRYRHASQLFNTQSWYAAHDSFEELWHESSEPVRSLLQGIIQIAVSEYHLGNENIRGATLLMAEGLNRLIRLEPSDFCVDLLGLTSRVQFRLSTLQKQGTLEDAPLPFLSPLHPVPSDSLVSSMSIPHP